ncbi:MAG: hypothetical protein HUN04_01735 [Desulfobacter sp.]|nr:MAG: hypothetical protein HUN04_01735 [Desulfobacter sp.]
MKINTSKINLSASGQYLENLQMEKKTRLKFSRLYDDQLPRTASEKASVQKEENARYHSWHESQTIDTSDPDRSSQDLYIDSDGKALYQAFSFFNQKISNLEYQNGTLDKKNWAAHLERFQTMLQYGQFAPSLNDIFIETRDGDMDLFDPSASLSESQTERKQTLEKAMSAEQASFENNAMKVAKCLMKGAPLYEDPDALLQDIGKMKDLIEKIGEQLSALSNGPTSKNKASASEFKNTRIDWANLASREGRRLERGGYAYEYEEEIRFSRLEKENVNFLANGTVNTIDGESVNFSIELNFAKEVYQEESFVQKKEGYVFIDPLVINLDGTLPRLSEAKFRFDLDADGSSENISMLSQGSGFLCLDKNQDGIINDGSELFGPGTGNGFLELLRFDQDENFWIDENDEIFDELSFWENDGTGKMQLTKIKDAGIGAIYLASANTPIDMLDEAGNVQARIKKSGIALNEDGSTSSVVEMDWLA